MTSNEFSPTSSCSPHENANHWAQWIPLPVCITDLDPQHKQYKCVKYEGRRCKLAWNCFFTNNSKRFLTEWHFFRVWFSFFFFTLTAKNWTPHFHNSSNFTKSINSLLTLKSRQIRRCDCSFCWMCAASGTIAMPVILTVSPAMWHSASGEVRSNYTGPAEEGVYFEWTDGLNS